MQHADGKKDYLGKMQLSVQKYVNAFQGKMAPSWWLFSQCLFSACCRSKFAILARMGRRGWDAFTRTEGDREDAVEIKRIQGYIYKKFEDICTSRSPWVKTWCRAGTRVSGYASEKEAREWQTKQSCKAGPVDAKPMAGVLLQLWHHRGLLGLLGLPGAAGAG